MAPALETFGLGPPRRTSIIHALGLKWTYLVWFVMAPKSCEKWIQTATLMYSGVLFFEQSLTMRWVFAENNVL